MSGLKSAAVASLLLLARRAHLSAGQAQLDDPLSTDVAQPETETSEVRLPGPGKGPKMAWQGDNLHLTHYWDCSGQGCDAATLQPWDESKYVSAPGYGPQDPRDFGGPAYGEAMWLTGAASDALSALMGPDDGCCGADPNDGGVGGCGKCVLVQNPDSLHPDWTAVVMKKSRCPPWSNGCGEGMPHLDIAAPGFDNLQYSTANVCGKKAGTGFDTQMASEAAGRWYERCETTAACIDLCLGLEPGMRRGCQMFAKWGWKRGDPKNVRFKAVECPAAFVKHIGSLFGPRGPQEAAEAGTTGTEQASTSSPAGPATTTAASTKLAASSTTEASSIAPGSTTTAPVAPSSTIATSTMPVATSANDSAAVRPREPEGECLSEWTRCGGDGWAGHGSCCAGLECHVDNPWWSVCLRASAPKTVQATPPPAPTPTPDAAAAATTTALALPERAEAEEDGEHAQQPGQAEPEGACLKAWARCGGEGWAGQGACCDGLRCHYDNKWWSVCLPGASLVQEARAQAQAKAPSAAGRGGQGGSFLAPVQRHTHMLHEAPALVQGRSALSRRGPASDNDDASGEFGVDDDGRHEL